MDHPLITRREIDFLLHDWLGLEALLDRVPGEHNRETVDAILDLSERLAVDHFLPHYKEADRVEPWLDADGVHILPAIGAALAHYAELGLFAASFAPEIEGLGLPFTVTSAAFAYFAAANIATAGYAMLTIANARVIATFGTPAQIETFALPQIRGAWFGTMCLSEPQAGSDLGVVKTRALREGEDQLGQRYRLAGNKMWISGGEQDVSANIVHLVLAKVPLADGSLPEGTAGLSLFIVPRLLPDGARNDVVVAGLNHKMGYRGTANCLLNFGEREGAIGWLVGREGEGLRQMFLMMNEARIGVGLGAAALGYRSYRHALHYAQDRIQGRQAGAANRAGVPIITHPDVKRMLLAQKAYAEGALALCLYCARLVDEEAQGDADSAALLGLLTPVAKTWSSEYGLAANDLAIQIHGGYGYTRDFDVEQIYRDNRLNPIHEGTTGIQAIDLLGRKILRDGAGLDILRRQVETASAAARDHASLAPFAGHLDQTWALIDGSIAALGGLAAERRLDNATFFLAAFGHSVVAWLWLEQALAATRLLPDSQAEQRSFLQGKLAACRFFFDHELTKVPGWLGSFDRAWDWSQIEAGSL